mmetsp:Transcript_22854/g.63483  ORF Transcript_22854/g.63483 Transcript_22854/m.63483 type:complete len:260 (+) Transcript_22854:532-1311(+)
MDRAPLPEPNVVLLRVVPPDPPGPQRLRETDVALRNPIVVNVPAPLKGCLQALVHARWIVSDVTLLGVRQVRPGLEVLTDRRRRQALFLSGRGISGCPLHGPEVVFDSLQPEPRKLSRLLGRGPHGQRFVTNRALVVVGFGRLLEAFRVEEMKASIGRQVGNGVPRFSRLFVEERALTQGALVEKAPADQLRFRFRFRPKIVKLFQQRLWFEFFFFFHFGFFDCARRFRFRFLFESRCVGGFGKHRFGLGKHWTCEQTW